VSRAAAARAGARAAVVALAFTLLAPALVHSHANATGSRWRPDVASARHYAKSRAGDVSFSVVDLDGHARGLHAGRNAPLASVFKTLLLAVYLEQRSVRDRELHRGERELLGPMIRRSDDDAASAVNAMLGAGPLERLSHRAHLGSFSYVPSPWGLSSDDPRDLARFMYRLDRWIPARHEAYARRLLASVKPSQRWGVGQVKPRGWALYFKGGWGSGTGWVNHQIALLERGDCSVSLALFTRSSPSHDYASETLKGLAKRLLDGLRRRSGC